MLARPLEMCLLRKNCIHVEQSTEMSEEYQDPGERDSRERGGYDRQQGAGTQKERLGDEVMEHYMSREEMSRFCHGAREGRAGSNSLVERLMLGGARRGIRVRRPRNSTILA